MGEREREKPETQWPEMVDVMNGEGEMNRHITTIYESMWIVHIWLGTNVDAMQLGPNSHTDVRRCVDGGGWSDIGEPTRGGAELPVGGAMLVPKCQWLVCWFRANYERNVLTRGQILSTLIWTFRWKNCLLFPQYNNNIK